jgi:hypothetical protein
MVVGPAGLAKVCLVKNFRQGRAFAASGMQGLGFFI